MGLAAADPGTAVGAILSQYESRGADGISAGAADFTWPGGRCSSEHWRVAKRARGREVSIEPDRGGNAYGLWTSL